MTAGQSAEIVTCSRVVSISEKPFLDPKSRRRTDALNMLSRRLDLGPELVRLSGAVGTAVQDCCLKGLCNLR